MGTVNEKSLNDHADMDSFLMIISQNEIIKEVFNRIHLLNLKEYYIGAGCLVQTIWNYLDGMPLVYGIEDIDIVYYDDFKLSYKDEDIIINKAKKIFSGIPIKIDIKNQARVHLWYEKKFGYQIEPFLSLEEAIDNWPTKATSIGLRKELNESWTLYAPYGLNDIFNKVIRANKKNITKEIYHSKVNKWALLWNDINVISWEKS